MRPDDTVAVVGISVTYPDALTPDQLWDGVLHQRTAFRPIPDSRLPHSEYVDLTGSGAPDLTYVQSAALVEGWAFDPVSFRVPQGLFEAADMSHWLALDTASRLMDGLGTSSAGWFRPDRTGVVLGNSLTGETSRANAMRLRWPFIERTLRASARALGKPVDDEMLAAAAARFRSAFPAPGDESLAGALANTIAGRICNYFDLHGTGYTVDAACSSSLLAVMTARRLLLSGELDLAVSGGVDMSLDPFELVGFARLGALSRGEMRVYDAEPTGFLPGEGCGLVALMRTSDAVRHDLPVYAVIAGAGMSSDGAGGLTRPARHGQVAAASRAYSDAGVDPATVGLFEGHGTGTGVGDPIELATFRELRRGASTPAVIGSIKANIGHTKAAAGVAGLIKATLAVHHRLLPPATGVRRPHPLVAEHPELELLSEPRPWTTGPRHAGVSAMGFGGINTHVVLTEPGQRRDGRIAVPVTTRTGPDEIMVLTASNPAELRAGIDAVTADIVPLSDAEVRDLAVAVSQAADLNAPYRLAFTIRHRSEALAALTEGTELLGGLAARSTGAGVEPQFAAGKHAYLGAGNPARVGLLFPGQAAPIIRPDNVLAGLVEPGELLSAARNAETIAARRPAGSTDTRFAQPSIVGASLLGLAWLRTLGAETHRAVGHSLGEISALIWSGALAADTGVALVEARGRIMSEYGMAGTSMASVAADEDTTADLIAAVTGDDDAGPVLVVAGTNSVNQTTVAGTADELAELAELARRRGVGVRRLAVSHGFHSRAMAPATEPFRRALDEFDLRSATGGVISTVTGTPIDLGPDELRVHLCRQLVAPVRFREALERLAKECHLLVECGPGRMLGQLSAAGSTAVVSMDVGGDPGGLARSTAALAASGRLTHLERWYRARSARPVARGRQPVLLSNPCGLRPGDEASPPPLATPTSHAVAPDPGTAEPVEPAQPAETADTTETANAAGTDPAAGELAAHDVVIDVLAELTGLGADQFAPELSLSRDLHLNSLQVGQVIARAVTRLDRAAPAAPLALADATVAELTGALTDLPRAGVDGPDRLAGALAWTARFDHHWQPSPPGGPPARPLRWDVVGGSAPDSGRADGRGLLVVLDGDHDRQNERIVEAIRRVGADGPYDELVIAHGGDGAGVGRSLLAELERPPRIVCVQTDRPAVDWLHAVPAGPGRFEDLRLDGENWSRRITQHLQSPPADPGPGGPLGVGDVCVVTGGVTGITAECAAELAERTGAKLLFTGRRPADDEQIAGRLTELTGSGLDVGYHPCDLTRADDLSGLWTAAGELGPVRGLVHGAGLNVPQPMGAVTTNSLAAAAAVKHVAFEALLAQCPWRSALALVVTFGSIIGRAGLAGQTDYCLANDRLRHATERYGERAPGAVVRHLEWSVWSAVGMGVDLGVLDSLARSGVAAIGPADGRRLFAEAILDAGPVTQLLTARLPTGPTLVMPTAEAPPLRYVETVRTLTAGVEIVVESEVGIGTDRTVADHRIDGLAVLPAVSSLEAIAQTAGTLDPGRGWHRFTDVRLDRPVTVDDETHRTMRVAVRTAGSGAADVRVRADDDAFGSDCVALTVHAAPKPPGPQRPGWVPDGHEVAAHLYGPLYFHRGGFQCVARLDRVGAGLLDAELVGAGGNWFSRFLPGRLLLGDPGLLDASIHALQACYPGRRLLPVQANACTVHQPPGPGRWRLLARERPVPTLPGTDVSFDVTLSGPDGPAVEWTGLVLRRTADLDGQHADPRLAGAHTARRIRELGWDNGLEAAVTSAETPATEVLATVAPGRWGHSPAGRLHGDGFAATAICGGLRLTIWSADRPVGVDWLEPGDKEPPALGPSDAALARRLAAQLDARLAAYVAWAAREAVIKAGYAADAELTVRDAGAAEIILASTAGAVLVSVLRPAARPLVVAAFVASAPERNNGRPESQRSRR